MYDITIAKLYYALTMCQSLDSTLPSVSCLISKIAICKSDGFSISNLFKSELIHGEVKLLAQNCLAR